MTIMYITTDAFEAETLMEDTKLGQESKYKYKDIEPQSGMNLTKKLGFNPMCSVLMNEGVSAKELEDLATKLVKEGLYVATEMNGGLRRYIPCDAKERGELVKFALQKQRRDILAVDPTEFLLLYSNNPNKIQTFGRNYEPIKVSVIHLRGN